MRNNSKILDTSSSDDELSEESLDKPPIIFCKNKEIKFQLSEEIYDILLRNISPKLDEFDNVIIEFDNQEAKKKDDESIMEVLKDIMNYTSYVIINPKKNTKKAKLIYLEEAKPKNQNNLNSQYFEQIRDISIAKIWIKSCLISTI